MFIVHDLQLFAFTITLLVDQQIFLMLVQVWDLTAGKPLHDFKFHEGHIRSLDFHPLEFLLATGELMPLKLKHLETIYEFLLTY